MTESFAADWLALRARADASARDRGLAARAADWLAARRKPLDLVDLGAGAGNNVEWLAPRLPGPQRWLLVDHDRELLARAVQRCASLADRESGRLGCTTLCRDLSDAHAALPDGTDLATASALFDLVSQDWIEALADRCAAVGCAALWTLSIDGSWHFVTADGARTGDAEDREMRRRLAAHQHRDKGLGPALGGDAPGRLAEAFARRGFEVARAPSPWRLEPGTDLSIALLDGWHEALVEQSPEDEVRIEAWWRARRDALERAELGVVVGHVDVWAEPSA